MAHAYVVSGAAEAGTAVASAFAADSHGLTPGNPDLTILRYDLFSVEHARQLWDIAAAAPIGTHKVIVVSASRFFHEAQNALLKLFEEPPPDTTLILVVPSEGILLPTLRSRLAQLPQERSAAAVVQTDLGREFLKGSSDEREKLVTKLIDRSKDGSDSEKQQARSAAMGLAEDLLRAAEALRRQGTGNRELLLFIDDVSRFLPLLHTRSAPLKLIFEHLLLVIPKGLHKTTV